MIVSYEYLTRNWRDYYLVRWEDSAHVCEFEYKYKRMSEVIRLMRKLVRNWRENGIGFSATITHVA